MSYVDLAVGIGVFLLFFAFVMLLSITYFTKMPESLTITEFKEKATDLFDLFFETEGAPSNWEDTGEMPSEIGLITRIYRIPISVKEPDTSSRQNESIIIKLTFDEECENKAWNDTVRVYDEDFNETSHEFLQPVVCTSQFLNESYVIFNVNISQNEEKRYYVYYYSDSGVPSANHTVTISTASWEPSDGDSWTESTDDWSNYGGVGTSVATNSTTKWWGSSSVQVKGSFDSTKLGLEYNPSANITGVSNGWYIDAWLYADNISNVDVNVSLNDNSETIYTNITDITEGTWYHLEKELAASEWDGWSSFDASNGIDYVRFYMVNHTSGLTKALKVDQFHFELKPLEAKDYPEQPITVVSRKKVDALSNFTYDELRAATGEEYKFRIEIGG